MLETDDKWANEYLTETLSGNSEIKFESVKFSTYEASENFKSGFGVDLGKGLDAVFFKFDPSSPPRLQFRFG